jgi:tetratricopeptide (TPR) repeat protein
MTAQACKYHPETTAHWYCEHCQIPFCSGCITTNKSETGETCPICNNSLVTLGNSRIGPFWNKLASFFLYPFHLSPLLVILIITGINTWVMDTTLGFLIQIAIFMVFVKYSYVVLADVAGGYLKPRRFEISMLTENLELPFKMLFVIFVYAVLNTSIKSTLGDTVFSSSLTVSSFLFPASIMLMASSNSFMKAISPFSIARLIKTIGFSYLLLFVFLTLLVIGIWASYQLLLPMLTLDLYMPIMLIIGMYFTLVTFNMMGYVLYQYHEVLGYKEYIEVVEPDVEVEKTTGKENRIDILLQEGKANEAVELLANHIQQHPTDFKSWERQHRILLATKNKAGLQKYSSNYIVRLLLDSKPSEAIRIYLECFKLLPDFKIEGAKNRHNFAKLLMKSGQSRAALALLNDLHKDYPSYEQIPEAYLLVARIMFEYFNHENKSRRILEYILKQYPQHPAKEEATSYLSMLDNIT